MKCSEAQQLIKPYIKHKLSYREMEEFLDHVENCQDCREELEIYFSIYETLELTDKDTKDENYDFKKKLEQDIENAWRDIYRKKASLVFRTVFLAITAAILLLTAFTGIEMSRSGSIADTTLYRLIYGAVPEAETENSSERMTEKDTEAATEKDTEAAADTAEEKDTGALTEKAAEKNTGAAAETAEEKAAGALTEKAAKKDTGAAAESETKAGGQERKR